MLLESPGTHCVLPSRGKLNNAFSHSLMTGCALTLLDGQFWPGFGMGEGRYGSHSEVQKQTAA